MVEVLNATKAFGTTIAVQEVSFRAQPGEVFGLIGPNGAGKTTIIRMIMNILAPDAGEIRFNGKPISERDKDRIGYLPEERGLYRNVKVREMLLYLASLKSVPKDVAKRRIDEWLERFSLSDWSDSKISELSKGMAQKVQLIGTILHDPEFIFLDEPFSGLDPVSTDQLRGSIDQLGRDGKTVLFSTHNMEQAERICSRIFLINRGRELLSGQTDEIKAGYGHRSVVIEFDGSVDGLEKSNAVQTITRYPRYVEVQLADGAEPNTILESVLKTAKVTRFELVTPSLHRIFVDQVGGVVE